jgi:hypothetical protein
MARGLTAEGALALADALEEEGRLLEAAEMLTTAIRLRRDVVQERRLVRLRHRAFALLDRSLPPPAWPPFVPEDLPGTDGSPIVEAGELTSAVLRNGILRHGCLVVRGLIPAPRVARLCEVIDRAFEAFDATVAGNARPEMAAWFDPFEAMPHADEARAWARKAGGIFTADSPRAFFEFLATMQELGIDRLITAYLGERPTLSAEKCMLRKTDPGQFMSNWHQDGAFLGDGIRTVDAWFALSPCGIDAPGMDVLPFRIDRLLTTGEGDNAAFDWTVSAETLISEFPDAQVWRPVFEPGDAIFLDHLSLHRTGAYPGMTKLRYALESWWFASSAYPRGGSTPILV